MSALRRVLAAALDEFATLPAHPWVGLGLAALATALVLGIGLTLLRSDR